MSNEHQELLDSIREGGFIDWMGKGKPWTTNTDYLDERYYDNTEWPSSTDPEEKIRAFIAEALEVEKEILADLVDEGMEEDEAIAEACQWPLVEDAPIEAVRAYLRYDEENAEAAREGFAIE